MKRLAVFLYGLCASALAGDDLSNVVNVRDALQEVPFAQVVEATTGHRVVPVSGEEHRQLIAALSKAMDDVLEALNRQDHPLRELRRVNEASRFVEEEIRARIGGIPGWKCEIPRTSEGAEQRTGYPDLRGETADGLVFYLDPKLLAADSRGGTLRSFYYEPKLLTGKIHDDAVHLLVGIQHDGGSMEKMRFVRWELVDLSRVTVRLKAEFQASNRDLYSSDSVVAASE